MTIRYNPRLLTAIHEAGHAVALERVGIGVRKVTMINFDTGQTLGVDVESETAETHEALTLVALAGFAAVNVVIPDADGADEWEFEWDPHDEHDSDHAVAAEHARSSGATEADVPNFLRRCYDAACALLRQETNQAAVLLIAARLNDSTVREIDGEEVRRLLRAADHQGPN